MKQYTPLEGSNLHKLFREPIIVKYFSGHKDEWTKEVEQIAESDADVFYRLHDKLLNLYKKLIDPIGRKSFIKNC